MTGSIRQRAPGVWETSAEGARDPGTGKRRRLTRRAYGSRRDAEQLRAALILEAEAGTRTGPTGRTTGDYLDRWIDDYAAPNVAPSTLRRYRQICDRLRPFIGHIPLDKLEPLQIQAAYAALLGDGLCKQTVLHHHRLLRQALAHAVTWDLLARNPADRARPPRPDHREMHVLDAAQLKTLLAAAADPQQARLLYTAAATGLRQGELLGLRWPDVDGDAGVLHVRMALQYTPGVGLALRPPKTARSQRAVALSAGMRNALAEQRRAQAARRAAAGDVWVDNDLVFCDPIGGALAPYAVAKAFQRLLRQAGLPRVRFHDLRHTAATLMLTAGVHPKIVSERLGHASVSITLDTYSHVLPSLQQEAAERMDAILAPPPPEA